MLALVAAVTVLMAGSLVALAAPADRSSETLFLFQNADHTFVEGFLAV